MQAVESYRENPFLLWDARPERPLDDAGTGDSFTEGFQQYFSDQARFLQHLDDALGFNGAEAQALAVAQGQLVMGAVTMFANGESITIDGTTINVRDQALSSLWGWIQNNPKQFAGRQAANGLTGATLALPLSRGGVVGIGLGLVFAGGLTTTAGIGAGLNAIDQGMQDPVSILTAIGSGGSH